MISCCINQIFATKCSDFDKPIIYGILRVLLIAILLLLLLILKFQGFSFSQTQLKSSVVNRSTIQSEKQLAGSSNIQTLLQTSVPCTSSKGFPLYPIYILFFSDSRFQLSFSMAKSCRLCVLVSMKFFLICLCLFGKSLKISF